MRHLFITQLFEDPQYFFQWIILVILSVCLHEYAHAQTALWLGDTTARDDGHLTLNPLRQMGITSLIMLAFIGIAWGAVPVNPSRMPRRWGPALVSAAGPLMNLLLYLFFIVAMVIGIVAGAREVVINFFFYGAILNFVLCAFNLLPVPPLDGWGIFEAFSKPMEQHPEWVKGGSTILFIVMLMFGFDYLYKAAVFVSDELMIFILTAIRNFL